MFVCLLGFPPLSPFSLSVSTWLTPSHPYASGHRWDATLCGMKGDYQVAPADIASNAIGETLTHGMWQVKGSLTYEFPSPLPFLCAVLPSPFSSSTEIPWGKHMCLQRDLLCLLPLWCEIGASPLMYHTALLHVFLASSPFPQPNQYRLITPQLSVCSLILALGHGQLVSDVTNPWNETLKFDCSPLWNNRNLLLVLCRLTSSM